MQDNFNIIMLWKDTTHFLKLFWQFLNQNIVSAVIGALIFAVIAGVILDKILSRGYKEEVIVRISTTLRSELEFNKIQAKMLEINLDNNSLLAKPVFKTSGFDIAIKTDLLKALDAKSVAAIIAVYDIFEHINELYGELWDYSVGVNSALSNSGNIREFAKNRIKDDLKRINILENELDVLISDLKKKELHPELDITSYQPERK